ncbi:Fused response regulator/phosphatase OS=Stutzerimonas stutzeri OX=316 GN=CXK95_00120 PE=4 SV=1 [Stutzerimonas stutzeri]
MENRRYRERLESANRDLQASLHLLQEDQDAGRRVQMNVAAGAPWSAMVSTSPSHSVAVPAGDFVDYFRVDDRRIGFYLADVSGHGASSAFVTVLLKLDDAAGYESRRRRRAARIRALSEVLDHINRGLINSKLGKHVTMLGGVIDIERDVLHYSIGGHLPMPVLYTGGAAHYLEGRGRR